MKLLISMLATLTLAGCAASTSNGRLPTLAELESANGENPITRLQPGYVVLRDGSRRQGRISQDLREGRNFIMKPREYALTVNFVDESGQVSRYSAEMARFAQAINGQERLFTNYRDAFTEILADGEEYSLFINPYPLPLPVGPRSRQQSSAFADFLAREIREEIDEYILRETQQAFAESLQDGSDLSTASRDAFARGDEVAGRFSADQGGFPNIDDIPSYPQREYIIRNNRTKNIVFAHNNAQIAERVQPLLAACREFQGMNPADKNNLLRMNQMERITAMLNQCN